MSGNAQLYYITDRTQIKSSSLGDYIGEAIRAGIEWVVPVRGDQVKAVFKDGVLEIRVPKADEARTREIEVQVAKS